MNSDSEDEIIDPAEQQPYQQSTPGTSTDTSQAALEPQVQNTIPVSQESDEQEKEKTALKLLSENPHLDNIFKKWIKQGIQEEIKSQKGKSTWNKTPEKLLANKSKETKSNEVTI